MKKIPKRIIFNVHPTLHSEIKIAATKRNITMTKYILEAAAWRLKSEKV